MTTGAGCKQRFTTLPLRVCYEYTCAAGLINLCFHLRASVIVDKFLHGLQLLTLICIASLSSQAIADDEQDAGLPVPRFVSLRSGEVNERVGPGTRYSINWVYKREDMPVEIIQEFDQWREIRDSDGTTGWVHKQMLQGKRTAIIKGAIGVLRHAPDAHSNPLLRAEPGVIGRLLECEKDWCRMQVSGHKGWIEKARIWGAYPKEQF